MQKIITSSNLIPSLRRYLLGIYGTTILHIIWGFADSINLSKLYMHDLSIQLCSKFAAFAHLARISLFGFTLKLITFIFVLNEYKVM